MKITSCKITSQTGKDFIFNKNDSDIFKIELTFTSAYTTISKIKITQGWSGEAIISTTYKNGVYTAKSQNLSFNDFYWDYLSIFGEFFSFTVYALDSSDNDLDSCNYTTNFRIYSSRGIEYFPDLSYMSLSSSVPFWRYFSEDNNDSYGDCYIEDNYSFSKIYSRLDYYPYLILGDDVPENYVGADYTPMGSETLKGNSFVKLTIFKGNEENNNIFYENIDNSPDSIFPFTINFPDPEEGISQKYTLKVTINLEGEVVKTFSQEILVYFRPEPKITLDVNRVILINNEYRQSPDGEIFSFTGTVDFNNEKNIPLFFEDFKVELMKVETRINKYDEEEEIIRAYNLFKKDNLSINFSENFSFLNDTFLYEKTKSFILRILVTDGFHQFLIEKKIFPTYNPILQLEKNCIFLNSAENKIGENIKIPKIDWEKNKYYKKDDICFYKGDYYLLLQETFYQGSIYPPDQDPETYQKITLDQTHPFLINGSSASYHFGVSYLEKTNFTSAWITPNLNSSLFTELERDTTSLKIRGNLDGFFEIQGSFKIGGAASNVERKIFSLPIIATPFKSMNFLVSTDKIGYLASLRIDSNGYLILERIFSGTTIYTNSAKIKINCNINYSTYPLIKRDNGFKDAFDKGTRLEYSVGQIIDYPNNETILEEDNPDIISASSFQEGHEPYNILIPWTMVRFGDINSWLSLETDLLPTLTINFPYPGTFSFDSLTLDVFNAKSAKIYLDDSKVAELNLEESTIFDFKNNYTFTFQEKIKIEFVKTEDTVAVEVSNLSINKFYRDANYFHYSNFYSERSATPFDYHRIIPSRKEEFFEDSYIEKINDFDYLGLWKLIIPEEDE